MSTYCEICEAVALAQSSTPATDVIMIRASTANATSSVTPFTSPQGVLVGTANASNAVVIDAFALMVGTAASNSSVSHTLVVTETARAAANAASNAFQVINEMAVATANITDEIAAADVPQLLVSAAQAVSTLEVGTVATLGLTSEAKAASFASLGMLEVSASAAIASSSVTLLRRVEVLATSSGVATDDADPSGEPAFFLLVSNGEAASVVSIQNEVNLFLTSTAEGSSDVWFADPALKAWVMNTETTAVNWYDNFGFESIAQVKGQTLAVGEDGIYELAGGTDQGVKIEAMVETGFTDWGAEQTKRLDNMYFGYTSEGQISVDTEVYESGHSPSTYLLEERAANAPRNSRVTPGKGLWGRYWRLTIRNVDGADFEVHDASVDIAVSSRRI